MIEGKSTSLFGSQILILALPLPAVPFLKSTAFQRGMLTAIGALQSLLFGLLDSLVITAFGEILARLDCLFARLP
jgi:hypothetical protein